MRQVDSFSLHPKLLGRHSPLRKRWFCINVNEFMERPLNKLSPTEICYRSGTYSNKSKCIWPDVTSKVKLVSSNNYDIPMMTLLRLLTCSKYSASQNLFFGFLHHLKAGLSLTTIVLWSKVRAPNSIWHLKYQSYPLCLNHIQKWSLRFIFQTSMVLRWAV